MVSLYKILILSVLIILFVRYTLRLFFLKFLIFKDELISGSKIKYYSYILFVSIIGSIYLVSWYYKILVVKLDSTNLLPILTLVLTLWAVMDSILAFYNLWLVTIIKKTEAIWDIKKWIF